MSKVSIVVPCFNQAAFISETLDSVALQRYADWECIVVDDGSTDGSAEIIRLRVGNDARFIYLRQANNGVSAARNLGFSRASGDHLLPLDGDDKLHPRFLQQVMACFAAHPETDLVHCKTRLFGTRKKIWHLPSYSYDKLLWQNMLVNSCVFTREAFARTSGYSLHMLHGFEDWEFYIRLLGPDSQVRFIDSALFFYRVKKTSRSTRQTELGNVEESMRQIYIDNRQRYEQFSSNPISVFATRMQDFAPAHTARYKRQISYLHAIYLLTIAILMCLLIFQ